jgi:hypothetical protein
VLLHVRQVQFRGVAVNQPGSNVAAPKSMICAPVGTAICEDLLDLVSFNQNGSRRQYIPGARIEQPIGFDHGERRGRLGAQMHRCNQHSASTGTENLAHSRIRLNGSKICRLCMLVVFAYLLHVTASLLHNEFT